MDLWQMIRADHANIRELCREILGRADARSRDHLFDQLERELDRHMRVSEAVLGSALQGRQQIQAYGRAMQYEHEAIRRRLDELAHLGSKDSHFWTDRFENLVDVLERTFGRVEGQVLPALRTALRPEEEEDLRHAFEREKIAALQAQRWHLPTAMMPRRYGLSNRAVLGVLVGAVAAAALATAWRGTSHREVRHSRQFRGNRAYYDRSRTMQQTFTSGTGMAGAQPGTFRVEDAREMMISGLRNAHGLEQQAIEMLERNAERLQNYPQLKARIAQHLEETRQQQAMVARALEELGESPSTLKDTVMGLAQNVQMAVHSAASDEVLKNSFAGYAFEHFEIASYRALMVMARMAGEPRVEQVAQQILRQEEEMANWLEQHLPEIVTQHIVLMASGQQKR